MEKFNVNYLIDNIRDEELIYLCSFIGISIDSLGGKSNREKKISLYNRFAGNICFQKKIAYWIENKHPLLSEIYISYAWPDLSNNEPSLVDGIYDYLVAKKYDIKRDVVDLHYGESIRKFMKKIGAANFIIIFLSDKYLKSPNCMFELCEIFRNYKNCVDSIINNTIIIKSAPFNADFDTIQKYWSHQRDIDKEHYDKINKRILFYFDNIRRLFRESNYYTIKNDQIDFMSEIEVIIRQKIQNKIT